MYRSFILALCLTLATPVLADKFQGRNFDFFDGRSDKTKSAPLLVALHPFLGTSKSMRKKTGFDALAKRHGFVVIYPNGVGRKWNDGRSARNKVDDIGYLTNLIKTVQTEKGLAANKVFLAGHSNGGGIAMRMACDQPSLVDGIAVGATKLPAAYTCERGKPVPAIFFFGTEDPVSPHGGRPKGSRLGETISADATVANWAKRNKCNGVGRSQEVDKRDDGTIANISHYSGCRAALTNVLITGHGHGWPGGEKKRSRLQGPATKEINATNLTWWFFKRL